jgi:hypothetical protein
MTLAEFLVLAKQNTYAKSGEAGEEKLPDGGRRFVFEQGKFKYQNTYYGYCPFSGQEIVWQNGVPVWLMNYWGMVLFYKSRTPGEINAIYSFLKKALSQVDADEPFRGPEEYADGSWEYERKGSGSVDQFSGEEHISKDGDSVYFLHYHGGSVQEKD